MQPLSHNEWLEFENAERNRIYARFSVYDAFGRYSGENADLRYHAFRRLEQERAYQLRDHKHEAKEYCDDCEFLTDTCDICADEECCCCRHDSRCEVCEMLTDECSDCDEEVCYSCHHENEDFCKECSDSPGCDPVLKKDCNDCEEFDVCPGCHHPNDDFCICMRLLKECSSVDCVQSLCTCPDPVARVR